MRTASFQVRAVLLLAAMVSAGRTPIAARADRFTYIDEKNETVELEARWVASGQEVHLLELPNGHYRIVPQAAVKKRDLSPGPEPLDAAGMLKELEAEFGTERFRGFSQEPYVMGLILSAPLGKGSESRATALLKKGAQFMKNVEGAFGRFLKEARIDFDAPKHHLVVLIFETEHEFEAYAAPTTDQAAGSLSAQRISGFYSPMTNALAIRLSECGTFDVPLHEAIHQQVYNRNLFQRLAPIPHWFDEGIATGFEASNGRITTSPVKVSPRYAKQALQSDAFDWKEMSINDRVFVGDVLAGEAYGQAWGLHWLMVARYKLEYARYLKTLAQKAALQKDTPEERVADFQAAFGKSVAEMENEFEPTLSAAIKRQKVAADPPKQKGLSQTIENLGQVELSAVSYGDAGRLQVEGRLTNNSPLRPMSFHVTVETDVGTYAEWLVKDLAVGQSVPLKAQYVTKAMRNGRSGGESRKFLVRIRSAVPGGEVARAWENDGLPVPVFQR